MQLNQKMDFPPIISKQYLSKTFFKRSFEWIRRHVLTDQELQNAEIDLEKFERYKDFPPGVGEKVKRIILNKFNSNKKKH